MRQRNYEVDPNTSEFSQGRNIASDAIRGFVVGVRGALEGRKLRRTAKDERERRFADEAYRQRIANYNDRKLALDDAFRTQQHEDVADIQGRLTTVEEGKYDHESHMYKLMVDDKATQGNLQREHEMAIAELQAAQQENNIEATTAAQIKVNDAKSKLDIVENRIQHREQMLILDKQGEINAEQTQTAGEQARKTVEATGAENRKSIQETGTEQRATLEKTQELEEAGKDADIKRRIDARLTLGMGTGLPMHLTDEARLWIGKVTDDLFQDQSYKTLRNSSIQWTTLLGTAMNTDPTAADDIALLNTFQRLIDPGVSVREGDVELLQRTLGFVDKLEVELSALKAEDGRRILTNDARQDFLQTAHNILSSQNNLLYNRVKTYAENMLSLHPELIGQIRFEDIVPQIFGELQAPQGSVQAQGRIPASETTQVNTTMPEPAKAKLIEGLVTFAQPIYDADPNFDDNDQQQLRDKITAELKRAETQLKLPANALLDKYAEELFKAVLEALGTAAPQDGDPEKSGLPTSYKKTIEQRKKKGKE